MTKLDRFAASITTAETEDS